MSDLINFVFHKTVAVAEVVPAARFNVNKMPYSGTVKLPVTP